MSDWKIIPFEDRLYIRDTLNSIVGTVQTQRYSENIDHIILNKFNEYLMAITQRFAEDKSQQGRKILSAVHDILEFGNDDNIIQGIEQCTLKNLLDYQSRVLIKLNVFNEGV